MPSSSIKYLRSHFWLEPFFLVSQPSSTPCRRKPFSTFCVWCGAKSRRERTDKNRRERAQQAHPAGDFRGAHGRGELQVGEALLRMVARRQLLGAHYLRTRRSFCGRPPARARTLQRQRAAVAAPSDSPSSS